MNKAKIMKQVLTFLAILFCLNSYSQGNWTLTGTKNRWGNGMGFSSKSASQLDAFTNASDSNLVQWSREDSTLAIRGSIYAPWRKLSHSTSGDFIRNQIGGNLSAQAAKFYITDTGWAAKLLRSNKGLIDSIQASSSAGGYLVTNGGAAVMHWGGGGSVEVDFKGFAGYDANRSSSYTARSFTDKGYVDSSFLAYTTLQNAYNNSSIPNITTNTTNRAVSIQRGTGADTDSVFVVRNGAGTVTSAITGDGRVLANKVNANDTIRTSGVGQFGDQFTIGFFTLPKLWVDGNAAINGTTLNINGSSPTYSIQTSPGVGATTSRLIVQSGGASAGTLSFPSLSTSRQWDLPNASGTIALTSNVTDSAAALRASINTKLNISDTAAMLTNYLRKTDTATMLSRLTFDRVLANGNTTGRTFTAGGATLTGALSGTSGTFVGGNAGNLILDNTGQQFTQLLFQRNQTANTGFDLLVDGTNSTVSMRTLAVMPIVFSTSALIGTPVERMRITTGGNVGIGTTSPDIYSLSSKHLTLSTTTASQYSIITAAGGAGGGGEIDFGNQTIRHAAIASSDGSSLVFYTNTTNTGSAVSAAGRITSAGRWLINTATDNGTDALQVAGNITATGYMQILADNPQFYLTESGIRQFSIQADAGNLFIRDNTSAINPLTITGNTGAATFSSSVTTNAPNLFKANSQNVVLQLDNPDGTRSPSLAFGLSGGLNGFIQLDNSTKDMSVFTNDGSTRAVRFAYVSGAATFSSSVTAKTYAENVVSVSTTYTVASDVGTVYASSNTYTITLPSAIGNAGRTITIKRTSAGLGTSITISGVTLGTSENGGSLPCHAAAVYRSDGTNWYCISYHAGGCN